MNEKIHLYHVSFDLRNPLEKVFIPRIPKEPMNREDETIPRICFSDSITGCINGIGRASEFFGDNDSRDIIVWELEVDPLDENLRSWEYLYEHDLVPDAAITHEYWYLKPLELEGQFYQILHIADLMEKRYEIKIIKPYYKGAIIKILSDFGVQNKEVEHLNACTLVNEWIPDNMNGYGDIVLAQVKKAMVVEYPSEVENEELYEKIFGNKPEKNVREDSTPLLIFPEVETRKL